MVLTPDLWRGPGRPGKHPRLARTFMRRLPRAPLHALPDFLIIGAMKAGTASLYRYLAAHPRVLPAMVKEVHYFDRTPSPWRLWYRAHFPTRRRLAARRAVTGEATPAYMRDPGVPARIRKALPEARLIAILRDPVARAISHYGMYCARRTAPEPFEAMLERIPDRDEGYLFSADDPFGFDHPVDVHDFVARGVYDLPLRRYLHHFPEDQVHVMLLEDLVAEPAATLSGAFAFLGLPDARVDTRRIYNRGGAAVRVPEEVRRRLEARFAPANHRLEKLLGRSLPWA